MVRRQLEGQREGQVKRIVLGGDRSDGLAKHFSMVRCSVAFATLTWPASAGTSMRSTMSSLGGFGGFDEGEPIVPEWRNAAWSRRTLGHAALAAHLRTTAARADASHHARLAVEVALADRGEGPTLFDRIVGIIRRHLPITLVLR